MLFDCCFGHNAQWVKNLLMHLTHCGEKSNKCRTTVVSVTMPSQLVRQPRWHRKNFSHHFVRHLRWIWRTKSSPVISFLDKNQSLSNFYDKAIGWTIVQMMRLLVGILYSSCLIIVAPILYPEINHDYPSFNPTYICYEILGIYVPAYHVSFCLVHILKLEADICMCGKF